MNIEQLLQNAATYINTLLTDGASAVALQTHNTTLASQNEALTTQLNAATAAMTAVTTGTAATTLNNLLPTNLQVPTS